MSNHFSQEVVEAARAAGVGDDLPDFGPDPLVPVDRSTLERYAVCPAQARFIELGRVADGSHAAAVGQEIHEAFSMCVQEYIDLMDEDASAVDAGALADTFRGRLLIARPDLQPAAIDAAFGAAWPWAKFLVGGREGGGIHPRNILRFDGGEGRRSGQLAGEVRGLNIAPTAELDFLYAGPSPEVLHEIDWKSGRTPFTTSTIAESFQFQMHAWLVFANYPAVSQLEVRVWRTRFGGPTAPVVFRREDLPRYEWRITSAAMAWAATRDRQPEACETWPGVEKCHLCPAAHLCPLPLPESCAADPAAFVIAMHALDCQLDRMREEAKAYVETHGDIRAHGLGFGFDKPATERRTSALYLTKEKSDAPDDE